MEFHRFLLGLTLALFGCFPRSALAQAGVVLNVTLSAPAATPPAPPPSGETLPLPSPVGSASFVVTSTNSGLSGPVTVTADTGHVPLPVTLAICQTDASTGICLTPSAPSASMTLARREAPTFSVTVDALAPIPLDATFHRVYVRFSDANGASVGAASLAIHNASYGRQIGISRGGTYSGNWSNDHFQTGAPGEGGNAVFVGTTEPVILENCFMRSTKGHVHTVPGANLTIRNCNAYGVDPGQVGAQRGYFLFGQGIGSLTMEHNYLEGMAWGVALWSVGNTGRWTPTGPIVVRYNKVRNLDGVNSDGQGGRVTEVNPNTYSNGFVSISQLNLVHGAEVAWNEVINEPYLSATADLINFWASPGTVSSPIKVHDNYIRGQYAPIPERGNGINSTNCVPGEPRCYNTYVAQVIVLDGNASGETEQTASSFINIYQNQLVNTWGGITLTAGHDNAAYANRVVSTGRLRSGKWMAPAYSAGVTVSDNYAMGPAVFYNNSAHDNIVGFVLERVSTTDPSTYQPPPIRSDYDFERSGCARGVAPLCFNNQGLPDPITFATEDNEAVLWQQKLLANSVTVGPVLPADCLFNWAERQYANLFRPERSSTLAWPPYVYRHYVTTNAYLGISTSDNHVYYIGADTGYQMLDVGDASGWLITAGCQ